MPSQKKLLPALPQKDDRLRLSLNAILLWDLSFFPVGEKKTLYSEFPHLWCSFNNCVARERGPIVETENPNPSLMPSFGPEAVLGTVGWYWVAVGDAFDVVRFLKHKQLNNWTASSIFLPPPCALLASSLL